MTIYVSGYRVLELPVPRADGVEFQLGEDGEDSFTRSVSGLSMSSGMEIPSTPVMVNENGKRKKMKVEEEETTMSDVPEVKVFGGVIEGNEEKALTKLDTGMETAQGSDRFEVTLNSTLRFYVYKKFV